MWGGALGGALPAVSAAIPYVRQVGRALLNPNGPVSDEIAAQTGTTRGTVIARACELRRFGVRLARRNRGRQPPDIAALITGAPHVPAPVPDAILGVPV